MQSVLMFFSSDPAAWLKTSLRIIHFCGLVLGVGAATLLDLIIVRFVMTRTISGEHVHVIEFSSRVVTVGLALLWFSGVGFLIHYGLFDPNKLWNPKIWAKISIVAVLSLNGVLVHHFVLPVIRRQVGSNLFDGLSRRQRSFLLFSGTVSGISWYVPLLLGAIPQLNFIAPAWVILSAYLLILAAAVVVTQGAVIILFRERSVPTISSRNKVTLWRGAVAAGIATIGGIVLTTGTTTSHTEQPLQATQAAVLTVNKSDRPKLELAATSASGASAIIFALNERDSRAPVSLLGPAPSLKGSLHDSATTAVWESDDRLDEHSFLSAEARTNQMHAASSEIPNNRSSAQIAPKLEKERHERPKPERFVGTWAADWNACPRRANRGGDLLTFVDDRGAWAGEGSCIFKKRTKIGVNEWEVSAICANGGLRWKSSIRLLVSGDKLSWSSSRGSQTYVRCAEKTDIAQVMK